MKTLLVAALALAVAPVWGQTLQFNFDALAAKAKEKVEIDLDGGLLALALKSAEGDAAKKLDGVTRLMVRSFEFEGKGAYTDSDLESVRRQLGAGTGWSRILDVKDGDEHTEIYSLTQNGQMAAFLLIAAEDTELTIVHIGGKFDLSQLASVQELVDSKIDFNLAALAR